MKGIEVREVIEGIKEIVLNGETGNRWVMWIALSSKLKMKRRRPAGLKEKSGEVEVETGNANVDAVDLDQRIGNVVIKTAVDGKNEMIDLIRRK